MPELNHYRSALSLVIYKQGHVEQSDIENLLARYEREQRYEVDRDKYYRAVVEATRHYWSLERCLFICTSEPCQKKSALNLDVNPSPTTDLRAAMAANTAALSELANALACPVELTGCHWQCADTTVTLKSGDSSKHFVGCSTQERWQDVQAEIKSMLDARSLPVPG